jgi:hypothetical protein
MERKTKLERKIGERGKRRWKGIRRLRERRGRRRRR